jgi:integral membrane protein (TIGR01906 family)
VLSLLRWLVVLPMPVLVLLTIGHLVLNEWYLRYEYAKPDFPPDPYGFTQAQRLELATVSIRFLNRPEPPEQVIGMLTEQRLPGTDQPLFTSYEISHMIDVKHFFDALWRVQAIAAVLVAGGFIALAARRSTRVSAYWSLLASGIFTTGLLLAIGLLAMLTWQFFFIQLHEVFFPPGTWTFDWSNSLIRLYPEKFWFDIGLIVAPGSVAAGIVITLVGWLLWRRSGATSAPQAVVAVRG